MSNIKLDKKLNMVLPINTDKHGKIYVHSMPLSREVFEIHWLVLSMTYTQLFEKRLGPLMGPRVCALLLKDVAASQSTRENDLWATIQGTLVQEIHRLTNILMFKDNKWETVPYQEVLRQKLLGEEVISEVENTLIYFIVASALSLREEKATMLSVLEEMYQAQITSFNVTEFGNSLRTSITPENIGETTQELAQKALLIPS
jgi:hypothetical protein